MSQSSVRTAIVVLLLVAALFLAMNVIIQNAPLEQGWPVLFLLALAGLIAFWERRPRGAPTEPLVEPGHSSLDGYRQIAAPEAHTPAITPTAASKTESESEHDEIARAYDEIRDTDVRSDVMASAATIHTAESRSTRGLVKNIMEVGATGTPEEVDEIAGAPVESISKDEPEAKSTPASLQPDDLTVIEGIGVKMAAALKDAGIDTFARLSSTSEADLRAAIGAAGMRFAPSVPTWPQQASLAMKGDWSGLKAYQETLKAGRKK